MRLVGARDSLSATKQQKLVALSNLTASEQAEASEIDALQAASAGSPRRSAPPRRRPRPRQRRRVRRDARRRPADGAAAAPSSSSGLIWPVSGPVTSPFGWRWGRMHEGIDIGAADGTPIHAAASGTVIYCGWESGYGNLVVIDHGGDLATAYGHQSSIAVSCGQHGEPGPGDRLRRLHRPLAPARTSTSRCASTATRSIRSAICSAAGF